MTTPRNFISKLPGRICFLPIAVATTLGVAAAAEHKTSASHELPAMSPNALKVDLDPSLFLSDPNYKQTVYDPSIERLLYTKWEVPITRPPVELGRQLFRLGSFDAASDVFGGSNLYYSGSDFVLFGKSYDILKREGENKNIQLPQILVYGDFRTGLAYNDNGDKEQAVLATRLNLDIDIRFTASERIHAFFTPLNDGGNVTRWDIDGERDNELTIVGNPEPGSLFFEGDLARIIGGFSDNAYLTNHDIPFTIGLIPLLFQNGNWLADAFTGFAVSIPARNSRVLDIVNMDLTFFAGFDQVNTGAIGNALVDDKANIYGVAAFVDAMEGYFEFGYGYTEGKDEFEDASYHNATASFTKRYFGWLSNSARVISNFGQDPDNGKPKTADGWLFVLENSLITSRPLTFVPYLNLFAGVGTPQSLARDPGFGGPLLNEGILFESDNLTGSPTLDGSARDTYGFSLGLNLLSGTDYEPGDVQRVDYKTNRKKNQQIVLEWTSVFSDSDVVPEQHGVGLRYQRAIAKAWIFRADLMYGFLVDRSDVAGVKLEVRRKF